MSRIAHFSLLSASLAMGILGISSNAYAGKYGTVDIPNVKIKVPDVKIDAPKVPPRGAQSAPGRLPPPPARGANQVNPAPPPPPRQNAGTMPLPPPPARNPVAPPRGGANSAPAQIPVSPPPRRPAAPQYGAPPRVAAGNRTQPLPPRGNPPPVPPRGGQSAPGQLPNQNPGGPRHYDRAPSEYSRGYEPVPVGPGNRAPYDVVPPLGRNSAPAPLPRNQFNPPARLGNQSAPGRLPQRNPAGPGNQYQSLQLIPRRADNAYQQLALRKPSLLKRAGTAISNNKFTIGAIGTLAAMGIAPPLIIEAVYREPQE